LHLLLLHLVSCWYLEVFYAVKDHHFIIYKPLKLHVGLFCKWWFFNFLNGFALILIFWASYCYFMLCTLQNHINLICSVCTLLNNSSLSPFWYVQVFLHSLNGLLNCWRIEWLFSGHIGRFLPAYPSIIPLYGFWMLILRNCKDKNECFESSTRYEACGGISVFVLQVELVKKWWSTVCE
jgi:hypothetical protein